MRYYLANIFQGAICTVQLRLDSRGTHLVFVLGRTENNPKKNPVACERRGFSYPERSRRVCYNNEMKNKILLISFLLVLVTGVLHIIGSINHLYWNSFWFDGLVHFMGGTSVGMLSVWFLFQSGFFEISVPSKREVFFYAIVCTVLIGIGWEVFEFAYGIAGPVGGKYSLDTYHDLLFDFLGGIVVGLIGRIKSLYV